MIVHSARIQGFHFRGTNFYIQMSRPEKDLNMNSRMTWLRNDPHKSVLVSTSERCCQTLFVFIHQASGIRHLKLTSRSWPPTTTPRHGGLNPPVPSNCFIIEIKTNFSNQSWNESACTCYGYLNYIHWILYWSLTIPNGRVLLGLDLKNLKHFLHQQ